MDSSVEVRADQLEQSGDARRLWLAAAEVMDIRSVRLVDKGLTRLVGRPTPPGEPAVEMRGRFLVEPGKVYDQLEGRFRELGYVLLLRRSGDEQIVLGIPGQLTASAGRPWIAVGMFLLTVLSTLWVGSGYAGDPSSLLSGWPFAVSLLGILLAHEMGHYLVARWQKIPATLPYFIPFPTILGTMGAVIQIKAPPRNRRALLLLGAAGPLAGLVVAIPVLLLGLSQSSVQFIQPGPAYFQEGNSLLYAALKFLVFGRFLPSNGMDVMISPVAFAGWAGLLVTGMNLIPAGQLDGGHIVYSLLGSHARWLTWGVVGALAALSLLWQGWLIWVALVLFLGRVHSVPLDDVSELTTGQKALAVFCILVLVFVFIPIPITIG
jgi:hypothetical protein